MENKLTDVMAKIQEILHLPEIDEPETYILTPQEEKEIIFNAIESLQNHTIWKMMGFGYSKGLIDVKILQIDWEAEIDKPVLLQRGNALKHRQISIEEDQKKDKENKLQKREDLQKLWTSDYVYKLMVWTCENIYKKKFILNDDNRHLVVSICYFISNDKRFETELGFDFNKGLLVRGSVGLGKTFLFKCVAKNKIKPIKILSLIDITDELRANGEFRINMGDNKILYLDDMGSEEPVVNFYGTKISYFKNLIESYYLKNQNFSGLVLSTNYGWQGVQELYGFRVKSRLKGEMMNRITVSGPDMREPAENDD